jgi:hypothetical protein
VLQKYRTLQLPRDVPENELRTARGEPNLRNKKRRQQNCFSISFYTVVVFIASSDLSAGRLVVGGEGYGIGSLQDRLRPAEEPLRCGCAHVSSALYHVAIESMRQWLRGNLTAARILRTGALRQTSLSLHNCRACGSRPRAAGAWPEAEESQRSLDGPLSGDCRPARLARPFGYFFSSAKYRHHRDCKQAQRPLEQRFRRGRVV